MGGILKALIIAAASALQNIARRVLAVIAASMGAQTWQRPKTPKAQRPAITNASPKRSTVPNKAMLTQAFNEAAPPEPEAPEPEQELDADAAPEEEISNGVPKMDPQPEAAAPEPPADDADKPGNAAPASGRTAAPVTKPPRPSGS